MKIMRGIGLAVLAALALAAGAARAEEAKELTETDKAVLAASIANLASPDARTRIDACGKIARLGPAAGAAAADALAPLVDAKDPPTRIAACAAILAVDPARAPDIFEKHGAEIVAVAMNRDGVEAGSAARQAVKSGGEAAVPFVVRMFESGKEEDQLRAFMLMSSLGAAGEGTRESLGKLLTSPNPKIRGSAEQALRNLDRAAEKRRAEAPVPARPSIQTVERMLADVEMSIAKLQARAEDLRAELARLRAEEGKPAGDF